MSSDNDSELSKALTNPLNLSGIAARSAVPFSKTVQHTRNFQTRVEGHLYAIVADAKNDGAIKALKETLDY